MDVEIAPGLFLPDEDLVLDFIRSPGPGGQNVNKVASAVQLRFNTACIRLDDWTRQRLATLAGRRLTKDGWIVIAAHRLRTQEGNRRDAFDRLAQLLIAAKERPKIRRPTRPTRGSKERRLDGKHQRTETKSLRRRPLAD
ncbi:MAG: alternative ribosome rescue aminoacyl-tRNA hydrolase ArfB [Pseudomonadota bacterium]